MTVICTFGRSSITSRKIQQLHLDSFAIFVGLGGQDYRVSIQYAFTGHPVALHFPFAGLALGTGMQHIKRAIASATPFPRRET